MLKEEQEFLEIYLSGNKEAISWCEAYAKYCHAVDDIIDENKDPEFILSTFEFSLHIYTSPFFLRNIDTLFPVIKMCSNAYMDSVKLERGKEFWEKHTGDVLRHQCNDVLLTVIELVSGYNKRREASLILRKGSYFRHHDEKGNPC